MGLLLAMAQVGQCWAGLSKSWAPHVDNSLDVGMNFDFFSKQSMRSNLEYVWC